MKTDRLYNIICFGFIPWSNMWKRNQSMMAELAKCDFVNKLIFINPLRRIFMMRNRDVKKRLRFNPNIVPYKASSNIVVYTPMNILPIREYLSLFKRFEILLILKIIKHLNEKMPYILFMNCPNIFSHRLLDTLLEDADLSVFDFSDDFIKLKYGEQSLVTFEKNITKYAKNADLVISVNSYLKEKYSYLNNKISVIRNATNYSNFARDDLKSVDFLDTIKKRGKKIIGYSGIANSSRIDFELFDYLLENGKSYEFILIGPADKILLDRYSRYDNFHHIMTVDYEDLPDYIHYFDVAIVPFSINDHTRGNDLLKLHDYLAMGKPIVSTDIGGAKDFGDMIKTAKTPKEFLAFIEEALSQDNSKEIPKRMNVAMNNSWNIRIQQVSDLIKSELKI